MENATALMRARPFPPVAKESEELLRRHFIAFCHSLQQSVERLRIFIHDHVIAALRKSNGFHIQTAELDPPQLSLCKVDASHFIGWKRFTFKAPSIKDNLANLSFEITVNKDTGLKVDFIEPRIVEFTAGKFSRRIRRLAEVGIDELDIMERVPPASLHSPERGFAEIGRLKADLRKIC